VALLAVLHSSFLSAMQYTIGQSVCGETVCMQERICEKVSEEEVRPEKPYEEKMSEEKDFCPVIPPNTSDGRNPLIIIF